MARCARAVKSRGRHLDDAGVRSTSRRPEHEGLVTRERSEVIVVGAETDVPVGAHREQGDVVDVEERGGRWFEAPCRLGRVRAVAERDHRSTRGESAATRLQGVEQGRERVAGPASPPPRSTRRVAGAAG